MDYFIYENTSLSSEVCDTIIQLFDIENQNKINGCKKNTFEQKINSNLLENNVWFDIKNVLLNEIKIHLELYYNNLDNNIFHFDITHKNKTINDFIIKKYIKHDKDEKNNISQRCKNSNNNVIDLVNKKMSVLNFIWYLNSIDNGGETEYIGSYKIKPEMGKIVLFPSDWFFYYYNNPPISSDKYIITGLIFIDI